MYRVLPTTKSGGRGDNRYAFAAAAGVGLIWIPEDELLVQWGDFIVHLTAQQEQHRFGIDHDGYAVVLDDFV